MLLDIFYIGYIGNQNNKIYLNFIKQVIYMKENMDNINNIYNYDNIYLNHIIKCDNKDCYGIKTMNYFICKNKN